MPGDDQSIPLPPKASSEEDVEEPPRQRSRRKPQLDDDGLDGVAQALERFWYGYRWWLALAGFGFVGVWIVTGSFLIAVLLTSLAAWWLVRRSQSTGSTFSAESLRWLLVGPLVIAGGVGLVVLLWLSSGIYTVEPGEQGVVRLFGAHVATTGPGLNYHLPSPIEAVDVVNVEQLRRTEVGFVSEGGQDARDLSRALMLTNDENIVEVQLIVQWRVKDAADFFFHVRGGCTGPADRGTRWLPRPCQRDVGEVVRSAMETVVRSVVGQRSINQVLTDGRAEIQEDTRQQLQGLLDTYDAGIHVSAVQLLVVDPPDAVKDAFHDVVRAREDRERIVNEAQAYREDILPKARGEAETIVQEAEAYKRERILRAQGDADRFLSILREYQKAPDVTRQRLYLEAVEQVLGPVRKIVLEPQAGTSIAPLLPVATAQDLFRPQPAQAR